MKTILIQIIQFVRTLKLLWASLVSMGLASLSYFKLYDYWIKGKFPKIDAHVSFLFNPQAGAWWLVLAIAILVIQHHRLRIRSDPKINIIFDRSDPHLVHTSGVMTLFRVRVVNTGKTSLSNVRVRFIQVEQPLNDGPPHILRRFVHLDLRPTQGDLENPQTVYTLNPSSSGQLIDVIQGPVYRDAMDTAHWEITYAEYQRQQKTRGQNEVVSPFESYQFPLRLTIEATAKEGTETRRTFMVSRDNGKNPRFEAVD